MELTIQQALQQGVAAHKEGKLQKAERLYRTILQSQPLHPDANHNLGLIAGAFGKYEVAVSLFKKAVAINGKEEQYWISLLEALIKLGNIPGARIALSQADPAVLKSDKIISLFGQLSHPSKLDFFYRYLKALGVFSSMNGELLNGESEPIPLLTRSFLDWFETQQWNSLSLLELGAGGSTLYFSKFFKSVTSYETKQSWFDKLLLKKPSNVNLIKVDTIFDALQENNKKDIHCFDVILIDAGENRAKLARWLVNEGFRGIIFFDNSEWYRKSIDMFLKKGFVEIPFFGLKPIEDWVSCTSILAEPSALKDILNGNWISLPKLACENSSSWDDEDSSIS
jgi:tetratricopeptide (TPR) repeat protein